VCPWCHVPFVSVWPRNLTSPVQLRQEVVSVSCVSATSSWITSMNRRRKMVIGVESLLTWRASCIFNPPGPLGKRWSSPKLWVWCSAGQIWSWLSSALLSQPTVAASSPLPLLDETAPIAADFIYSFISIRRIQKQLSHKCRKPVTGKLKVSCPHGTTKCNKKLNHLGVMAWHDLEDKQ